jgi:hypothetical protein
MPQVRVSVKTADAIRRGLTECGEREVTIESWDGWTDEERAHLANLIGYDGGRVVYTGAPTVEGLHERIREDVERAAKDRAEAEERQARLEQGTREREARVAEAFRSGDFTGVQIDQWVEPRMTGDEMLCPTCNKALKLSRWVPRPNIATDELRLAIEEWASKRGPFPGGNDTSHVERCAENARHQARMAIWLEQHVVAGLDQTDEARYRAGTIPEEELEALALRALDLGYGLLCEVEEGPPDSYRASSTYPRKVWEALKYLEGKTKEHGLVANFDVYFNMYERGDYHRWSVVVKAGSCLYEDVQLFEWELHVPTSPADDE